MDVHVTIFHKNFLKFSGMKPLVSDRGSLSVRSLRGPIAVHKVLPVIPYELSLSLGVCCRNDKTRSGKPGYFVCEGQSSPVPFQPGPGEA